jgi:hypothetical protein
LNPQNNKDSPTKNCMVCVTQDPVVRVYEHGGFKKMARAIFMNFLP